MAKSDASGKRKKDEFARSEFRYIPEDDEYECPAGERPIHRFTREENGKNIRRYWSSECVRCPIRSNCTPSKERRVSRWEHESVLEAAQAWLAQYPDAMRIRRSAVEHPFGTLRAWRGANHFVTRTLTNLSTEMSLHVLACNMKQAINLLGAKALVEAI